MLRIKCILAAALICLVAVVGVEYLMLIGKFVRAAIGK